MAVLLFLFSELPFSFVGGLRNEWRKSLLFIFLVHNRYGCACTSFITSYNVEDTISRQHFDTQALGVALNGVLQATSAILTFKFLPAKDDPGYFSDKAIVSRLFVKENLFYQLMVTK